MSKKKKVAKAPKGVTKAAKKATLKNTRPTTAAATEALPKAPPPAAHRFKEEKTLPLAVVEAAEEMLPRLREGSTISAERTKYGFKDNTMLRLALRELLGAEEYKKLIEQMNAVRLAAAQAAAAARPKGERAPVAPAVDDSTVPVMTAPEGKDDWKSHVMIVGHYTETVLVSPEGQEYVRASANQRADIIYQPKTTGIPQGRWRLLETSTQAKQVRREEKVAAARENSKKERKAKALDGLTDIDPPDAPTPQKKVKRKM